MSLHFVDTNSDPFFLWLQIVTFLGFGLLVFFSQKLPQLNTSAGSLG